jgi:hypothetical protein
MSANDNVPSMNLTAAQSLDEMLAMIRASDHLVLPGGFQTFGGSELDSNFAAMDRGRTVLSWDTGRFLIGTWGSDGSDCEIVARSR